ncbi:peptide chain release factor 1, partial [Striga asiatica]
MEASNYFRTASNHNVLFFYTEREVCRRHKRFQFNSSWVEMEGIQEAVKDGWQVRVEGSVMFQVHQKIKHTRMALLAWHKPSHRNSERVIKVLTEKLAEMRYTFQFVVEVKFVKITIRNGQSTRLSEPNWVQGLKGVKPVLRVGIDGNIFRVKDLLMA